MTIYAAILLLASTGSASRETTVPVSIERVLWGVVMGGVRDVARSMDQGKPTRRLEGFAGIPETLQLRIDDSERSGVFAWAGAAYRVAGYALDRRTDGSVEYGYRLRIRGFVVERRTRISDGCVVLTTDVWGRIGTRGELGHVVLAIRASERGSRTIVTGSLAGHSRIGDRCGLVRVVANRAISRALSGVLRDIETKGRRLYASGDIHAAGDALIERVTR